MRRVDREIVDFDEIVAIMRKCTVCRLALFDSEYPYILPLNFGMNVEGKKITLYFHGSENGKKYALIKENNKVGFEMDCSHSLIYSDKNKSCTWGMAYESVIGQGIIEILPESEKERALSLLMAQLGQNECSFDENVLRRTKVMRLSVLSCTAKRRKAKSEKGD